MAFYVRAFTTTCPGALIDSINDNVNITPTLVQIISTGDGNSTFDFTSTLSGAEETEFDNVLAAWSCPAETDPSPNPVENQNFDDTAPPDELVIWSSEQITNTFVPLTRTITGDQSITGGGDLTADRTLTLVNDSASPGNNKAYMTNGSGVKGWYDAASGTDVDEDHVIYVGKHGNDGNDGKTIDKAVLTFGQAITLCNAQTPTVSNQWGVVCVDNGTYTETLALTTQYTRIFAANAILEGSITLTDHTSFEFESLFFTGPGNAIEMSSGTGTAYGEVKHLKTDGANGIVNSSSGTLNVEIEYFQQTGGIGITNGSILHSDIQDWDVYGASPTLIKTTGGMTNHISANHSDRGGSGTSLGYDVDGGTCNVLAIRVELDTVYDVEAGALLNLMVLDVIGNRFNDGTVHELQTSHASDTSNPHQVTAAQVGAVDITGDTMTGPLKIVTSTTEAGPPYTEDHFAMTVHNTATSGGGGLFIRAGEAEDDIALRIMDQDMTFYILDVHADNGNWVFGAGFTDTKAANGTVYGFDNQFSSGTDTDFNTQHGTYRIAGVDVIVPAGGSANQFLKKIDGTNYNMQWADIPTDAVLSVDGRIGAVTLNDLYADISHTHAASEITSGTLANARISQASVTQHQGALTITESQVSDLGSYLTDAPSNGSEYVRKDGAWAIASSGGLGDAPSNGNEYVRKDGAWVVNTGGGGGAGALTDLSDVTLTSPATDDVLIYNGSAWVNEPIEQGGAEATLTVWTLESGDLYRADFTHSLGTQCIALFMTDTVTNKQIRPESLEVLNDNTVRIFVRGNSHSIKVCAVTGRGPRGPQGPSGSNTITLKEGGSAVTNTPHSAIDFDGSDFNVSDNGDGSATVTSAVTKTMRIPHTWAIGGEIAVASGDDDFINPFFISLATGQTATVVGARYKINSGTNCNVKIQKNGSDLTGFTNIGVTTTAANTSGSQSVTTDDMLTLVVNSISGTPKNLSFTLFVEYSV